MTSVKVHNSVKHYRNLPILNPNQDLVNINVYMKFSQMHPFILKLHLFILKMHSFVLKIHLFILKMHSFGLKLLNGNEILTLAKGHNKISIFTIRKHSSPILMPVQNLRKFIKKKATTKKYVLDSGNKALRMTEGGT